MILRNSKSLIGLLILVSLGTYSYFHLKYNSKNISSATEHQVVAEGSVSEVYASTDELVDSSDLVVRGRFIGKPSITLPKLDKKSIYMRDPGHRDLSFTSQEVLKGDKTQKQILVAQSGAIDVSSTPVSASPMSGDSFFEPGTEYILFLTKPLPHEIKPSGKNFYWITGAFQGAYRVKKNGKVISRRVELRENKSNNKLFGNESEPEIGPLVNGESENSVLSKIRNKVKKSSLKFENP